jgi:DNA-binding FadR family transcriptional regulator
VSERAALAQLRAYILDRGFAEGDRLPPERQLGPALGLRRSDLRRALETLVAEGVLWRHVGKGTFMAAPAEPKGETDLAALARRIGPADALHARLTLEPALAQEAALHASAADIARLRQIAARARRAATWREYEALDTDFHRGIAEASGSVALLALFDQLNTLRRMIVWGRTPRADASPPQDHPSFAEHDRIVAAIAARDPDAAREALRAHLDSVGARLFG